MINVDISNIWGAMSLPDLLQVEPLLGQAHRSLLDQEGNFLVKLPCDQDALTQRIQAAAREIREKSQVLVVLGLEGGCGCARGLVELLQGEERNILCREGDLQILFAGKHLSSRRWNALMRQLEGKAFCVCAAAQGEMAVETAAALRSLRWILERRYGTDGARERIYAVTGETGTLEAMAREEGWTLFETSGDLTGGFEAFSPVVLLTLEAAGLDAGAYLQGAREMMEQCGLLSYENPLWLYAGTCRAMFNKGMTLELLRYPEPDFRELALWRQDLEARRGSTSLFGVCGAFGAGEAGLDRLVCGGEYPLFETLVRFETPGQQVTLAEDARNADGLNALTGKGMETIRDTVAQATLEEQADTGVGVICVDGGELSEGTLGALMWFFAMSSRLRDGLSADRDGDVPGADAWRRHMSALAGKS